MAGRIRPGVADSANAPAAYLNRSHLDTRHIAGHRGPLPTPFWAVFRLNRSRGVATVRGQCSTTLLTERWK